MNDKDPIWLFNEAEQVGVDYTDEELVADYDKHHEGFRDFAEEAKKIVGSMGLSQQATVLDIGCGTGGLTIHFAQMCKKVFAVDVSSAMLGVLKGKINKLALSNIDTVQSGFLTYKHNGEDLDAIVANINLHHLPDFWKQIALCRFYDILKPGGKLFLADVVFGFEPRDYQEVIDSWLAHMQEHAGEQMADETIIHIRDEFSTYHWIMTGMLKRAGFQIDNEFEIMPHVQAYVCSKT